MKSRRPLIVLLLFLAPLVLTGCAGEMDPRHYLDKIEHLPLWQKITAVAVATLLSEDLVCIAVGLLCSEGVMTLAMGLLACFLGVVFMDLPYYFLGSWGGLDLLRKRPFRWLIREEQILQAEELFRIHGGTLMFTCRLLPGSRMPLYVAAGVLNYPFWRFLLYKAIAGALSTIVLVLLSYHLGDRIIRWLKLYESYFLPSLIGLALAIWIAVKLFEILATRRSRLVFLARMRRWRGRPRRTASAKPE